MTTDIAEKTEIPKAQIREGLYEMKTLLIDTMPCSPVMRSFITCWVISSFMRDELKDKGLLQIVGSSGIGKSKILERWSCLLDAFPSVGGGTVAAYRRLATKQPIVFIDNLENRDLIESRQDFLKFLAGSAANANSSNEINLERLSALGMISAIEPFPESTPELRARTFTIKCEREYRQDVYIHNDCNQEIAAKRDIILLAVQGLVDQEIWHMLTAARPYWMRDIRSYCRPNTRLDNHLCMMVIIAEVLSNYIPMGCEGHKLNVTLQKWLSVQEGC